MPFGGEESISEEDSPPLLDFSLHHVSLLNYIQNGALTVASLHQV
jgi:hypothetical protein